MLKTDGSEREARQLSFGFVLWIIICELVAGMVACVMAALFVARSVRRWTRLKKLRRQFEENEGRKLVARVQGRHSYTEFTDI